MDHTTSILIVDDDQGIRDAMTEYFISHGFIAKSAEDGKNLKQILSAENFDIIILDVMLPGQDGLSILRQIRETDGPPVIIHSALGTDTDRIVGLELGAEDYLAKPANPRELLARVRTVVRRVDRLASKGQETSNPPSAYSSTKELKFGEYRIDIVNRIVSNPQDRVIALSDSEFRLLRVFLENPKRILSRDQLLYFAHGDDSESYDRAIDVQISRLRRKLDKDNVHNLIRTIRNEGYMFNLPVYQTPS